MNTYINKTLFPKNCFPLSLFKYKRINEDINQLQKDFKIFLDDNEKKINKPKKNYYNFSINYLFKRLIFDSTNKLNKNCKVDLQKNKTRFISAREFQKYKERKLMLLKLIRDKKEHNIKSNITIGKTPLNIKKFNTIHQSKNKNSSFDNKISLFTTKSLSSQTTFRNLFSNEKNKKINNKRKINSKYKKISNSNTKIDSFSQKNSNEKLVDNNNNHIFSPNLNDDEDIIINNFNDKTNDKNNYSSKDDFFIFNYTGKKKSKIAIKKLNLKKLKLRIKEFEKSSKYYADNDIIHKALEKPSNFISEKVLKQDHFYMSLKGLNSTKNNSIRLKRIASAPKIIQKKTSPLIKKINIKKDIIYKKVDELQKKIKIKKNIIKKEEKDKKIAKKILSSIDNNNNSVDIDMNKEMKKDISKYQKNIGDFILVDGHYIYTSHVPFVLKNKIIYK